MGINITEKAKEFAKKAHEGQTRKDGVTPYYKHVYAVASLVTIYNGTSEMISAAYLHDVLEDCDVSIRELENEFGCIISWYVIWMTNISKTKNLSTRRARKIFDCDRLKSAPKEVKIIKLCDRIHNLIDLENTNDEDFKKLYKEESKLLYDAIKDGHDTLAEKLLTIINNEHNKDTFYGQNDWGVWDN